MAGKRCKSVSCFGNHQTRCWHDPFESVSILELIEKAKRFEDSGEQGSPTTRRQKKEKKHEDDQLSWFDYNEDALANEQFDILINAFIDNLNVKH